MSDVLLLVFAAILIAIALRGSASSLSRRSGLSLNASVAIIGLLLLAICGASIWYWGWHMIDRADNLADQLRSNFQSLRDLVESTSWGKALVEDLSKSRVFSAGQSVAGNIAGMAFSTFGTAGSVLIVVVTAIYLSVDPMLYVNGFVRLSPVDYRPRLREILFTIRHALAWWLLGRAIDMAAVFMVTYAGLWLLDMPAALPLAVVAAILNFVPYIGAFAGAAPAVLVALSQSPTEALWVVALFTGIQLAEGYILSPMIQKRTVSLPPVLTILSQTVFGALFGLFAIILAPALAVACMIIVRMAYVEDVLETPRESAGDA